MNDTPVESPRKKNAAADYHSVESLRDGRSVTVRAVRPDDQGLVMDALGKVSPQSLYFRLFSAKRNFSDEEIKPFTSIDFQNTVALAAVVEKEGAEQIVGGGRYVRMEPSGSGQSAEVAFLIDDAYQGLGIGSRLFKHLAAIARASGIMQFEAEVLPSNTNMLRLFARSGLPVTRTMTKDSVHIKIELSAAEAKSQAEGRRPDPPR